MLWVRCQKNINQQKFHNVNFDDKFDMLQGSEPDKGTQDLNNHNSWKETLKPPAAADVAFAADAGALNSGASECTRWEQLLHWKKVYLGIWKRFLSSYQLISTCAGFVLHIALDLQQ